MRNAALKNGTRNDIPSVLASLCNRNAATETNCSGQYERDFVREITGGRQFFPLIEYRELCCAARVSIITHNQCFKPSWKICDTKQSLSLRRDGIGHDTVDFDAEIDECLAECQFAFLHQLVKDQC